MKSLDFGNPKDYIEEHRRIITLAKEIRSLQKGCTLSWREPAEWGVKYSNLYGKPVKAMTITLSPTGCEWASKGGCTMCGEFEGSKKNQQISDKYHIAQFAMAVSKYVPLHKPAWLRIEQEGNYTNKNEVGLDAQMAILRLAASIRGIKRITIEARPQYIDEAIIKEMKQSVSRYPVELEIGMGLEAENDVVRNICVNKGETKEDFLRSVSLLKENNVFPLAYVLLKPPFLSEFEAINEAVNTINYANNIGFERISMEPVSLHKYTVVDALNNAGCYQTPWLWSVIEVANQCSNIPELGIGGVGYYPRPRYLSQNHHDTIALEKLGDCNEKIWNALKDFSENRDIQVFSGFDCECKKRWQEICNEDSVILKERISEQLSKIDLDRYYESLTDNDDIEAQNSILIAGGSQTHYVRN